MLVPLHWVLLLLQTQDVVDALYQTNDNRLPGHEVSQPVQQLSVHDMGSLPSKDRVKVLNLLFKNKQNVCQNHLHIK